MVTSTSTPGSSEMEVWMSIGIVRSSAPSSLHSMRRAEKATHNLLDDLAGGFQVDQALVDVELEVIPRLGTFTTRLRGARVSKMSKTVESSELLTDLRVVIFSFLVGNRTGPFTFSSLSLARLTKSVQTNEHTTISTCPTAAHPPSQAQMYETYTSPSSSRSHSST